MALLCDHGSPLTFPSPELGTYAGYTHSIVTNRKQTRRLFFIGSEQTVRHAQPLAAAVEVADSSRRGADMLRIEQRPAVIL